MYKRLIGRVVHLWQPALDQFGTVRTSKPVGVERAIRFSPPEGTRSFRSLVPPPDFDPKSLDELIDTGEWQEVPVKRR